MKHKQHKQFTRADIEKYYSGKLSAQEMHDMEAYALEDPFLSDAMDGYKNADKKIADANLEEARKFILQSQQQETVLLISKKNSWKKYIAAASILLMVAVGAFYLFKTNESEERIAVQTSTPYIDTTKVLQDIVAGNITDSLLQPKEDAIAIQKPREVTMPQNQSPILYDADKRMSTTAPSVAYFEKADTVKSFYDDVVVVGYGNQPRATITGAVPDNNNNDVANALQGRVAGVAVKNQKTTRVTATVKDDLNSPVPGVSVTVKNSNKGVVTNNKGEFNISVNEQDTLLISSVGYESKEITAAQMPENITLQPGKYAMDEVVVVGYGTQRDKRATARLNRREAFGAAPINTEKNTAISIRGMNTSGKDTPLIIIDGMIASQEKVEKLNKTEIESVNVLKDKQATAIYGARAANGVILITTKKAKKDSIRIKNNIKSDTLK